MRTTSTLYNIVLKMIIYKTNRYFKYGTIEKKRKDYRLTVINIQMKLKFIGYSCPMVIMVMNLSLRLWLCDMCYVI